MRAGIARSPESGACGHDVVLTLAILSGQLHLRSNCHAVALRADQIEGHPVVRARGDIAEYPCSSVEHGDYDVHVAVIEEIADNRAPIWLRDLHVRACLRGHFLECHFSQVAED